MSETADRPDVTALTVQLLSAYLANNSVASDELANLIRTTKSALTENVGPTQAVAVEETYMPAVTVRKSVASPDHILSLIDGKPYKTLKRHLASHGLTPDGYRERYNLPSTYPMVAPGFAAKRREIAQKIGLGSIRKPAAANVQATPSTEPFAEAISEPGPVMPTVKKAAGTAKPKATSLAQSGLKSSAEQAPIAEAPKDQPAAKKSATKAAGNASKKATPTQKRVKPAAAAKPMAVTERAPALEAQIAPAEQPKPKSDVGAKAASSAPKVAARNRKKASPAANAKAELAGTQAAKAAPRTKLGLVGGTAAESSAESVSPPAEAAASNGAEALSKASKTKRMARTPVAGAQG